MDQRRNTHLFRSRGHKDDGGEGSGGERTSHGHCLTCPSYQGGILKKIYCSILMPGISGLDQNIP